ncbi:MAG TPA: hypothetical protein VG275_08950 [Solirubrobacteraceae bacterium]|nr:hypothetical protein [Solirubrobacteraceae bacterium]
MLIRRLGLSNVTLTVAGAVAFVIEGEVRAKGGLSPAWVVLALAAAAPLAWRTRAPLAALIGVELGAILSVAAFDAAETATALVIVELYTVALLGDRQRSLVVGAVTAIGVIAVIVIVIVDGTFDTGSVAIRVALVFAALATGDTIRSRRELRAAADERAGLEASEREEEGRRRVADERLRIARELPRHPRSLVGRHQRARRRGG